MTARPRRRTGARGGPLVALLVGLVGCAGDAPAGGGSGDDGTAGDPGAGAAAERAGLLELWEAGRPAFGIFMPDERLPEVRRQEGREGRPLYTEAGARGLRGNPLYDYLFLNLEGAWDAEAVATVARGLGPPGEPGRPALLVRIPPISADGEDAAGERVAEVLAAGADGVVLPHVRGVAEARTALGFFEAAGADVWSPGNRDGSVVAMLMLEDPDAVAAAEEIAALGGFSVLACGIGSLTRALDGDREAAEAMNLEVLSVARDAGLVDMITADVESVEERIEQGFLALLMSPPDAEAAILAGRAAAGR